MSLLNLTPLQSLLFFLPFCAAVIALYLYDRSRRRQVVSTLRFFRHTGQPVVSARRRKVRQPWSMILQLASLTLLVPAVAGLQLGPWQQRPRDHVLILETSAWMNSVDRATGAPLMQEARRQALNYLRAIPRSDRVMLVRADQVATPVTAFTQNRQDLERAIQASAAGSATLDLAAALELAHAAQQGIPSAGEIVLVGSGRIAQSSEGLQPASGYPNLRAILIRGGSENVGVRKLAARRLSSDPATWDIDVGVFNYGTTGRHVSLRLALGSYRPGTRSMDVPPQSGVDAAFRIRSSTGGLLEAAVDLADDYPADNRATVQLPAWTRLRIQVFSAQPKTWETLFSTSTAWDPEYKNPREYSPGALHGRVIVLDGFVPSGPVGANAIIILPKAGRSGAAHGSRPIPVRWNVSHPITAGVHNRDLLIPEGPKLESKDGDDVVAESDRGPVIVASGGGRFKHVVFGFHPLQEGMANQLSIPLLFANTVNWMCPELLRDNEVAAGAPGLMELETEPGVRPDQIRVTSSREQELPFIVAANRIRFFAGQEGLVRVRMPGIEAVCRLDLVALGDCHWTPPPGTRRGVPSSSPSAWSLDLWPFLALAGAVALLIEWILFGRNSAFAMEQPAVSAGRGDASAVPASTIGEIRS